MACYGASVAVLGADASPDSVPVAAVSQLESTMMSTVSKTNVFETELASPRQPGGTPPGPARSMPPMVSCWRSVAFAPGSAAAAAAVVGAVLIRVAGVSHRAALALAVRIRRAEDAGAHRSGGRRRRRGDRRGRGRGHGRGRCCHARAPVAITGVGGVGADRSGAARMTGIAGASHRDAHGSGR